MKSIAPLVSLFALVPLAAAPAQAQCQVAAAPPLALARGGLSAVTVGGVALFAGGRGRTGPSASAMVDIYDASMGAPNNPAAWSHGPWLAVPRAYMGGTVVGNLALFAGGGTGPSSPLAVVDVYDALAQAWSAGTPLSQPRDEIAATTVGTMALFAGGVKIGGTVSARVDIYDASMGLPNNPAAWSHGPWLTQGRSHIAAVTVGRLALFAGGIKGNGTVSARVDVYDASVGPPTNPLAWSVAMLFQARALGSSGAAVAIGNRAYFGGGHVNASGDTSNVVDIYDASVGPPTDPLAWSIKALPVARGQLAATALGDIVLFAGGLENSFVTSAVVDRLDTGTGLWLPACNLTAARWALAAATVGGKALFAGGSVGPIGASKVVDVILPDVGTSYCLAAANSTGAAATISATGTSSVAANDLALTAEPVPNQPGVFFYGPTQVQQPFGNGFLCVGTGATGIARLPIVVAAGNVLSYAVDNTLPSTPGTQILPGSQWNFSAWYRDPAGLGAFFNLSDGLSIQFTP